MVWSLSSASRASAWAAAKWWAALCWPALMRVWLTMRALAATMTGFSLRWAAVMLRSAATEARAWPSSLSRTLAGTWWSWESMAATWRRSSPTT